MTPEEFAEAREWCRSRPSAIQELLRRFPPASSVCSARGWNLLCPAPGVLGTVIAYDEFDDGSVGVRVEDGTFVAECPPEALVLVAYVEGAGPDDIAAMLGRAS